MPSLLVELGCEELPADACIEAAMQVPELCVEHLGAKPSDQYIGPRRIAFLVPDLPERTPDAWLKGPPTALREKAAAGFARRHGLSTDQLTERDGFLGVEVAGRPLRELLPDRLSAIVRGFGFGKSMAWGPPLRFARPVRWILAKLDDETIDVPFEGIASGGVSYGHRFTHPGPVEVPSASAYLEVLRAVGVEPDRAVRYGQILAGLDSLGRWSDPLEKLDEVVYLVEAARVQEGTFDERFLRLPERVIVATMQSHQRYFPLGTNRFAFVANGGDPMVVRAGNEFVLRGRLEDAEFTFERDVSAGIEALADRLGSITFLAGAGSYAEKTERLVGLVRELGGDATVERAAQLAKADQAAELVREFPELQGHIGAQYAALAGEPEAVVAAIDDQYLPDSAGGPLPRTPEARVLSAADKLDNLRVAFGLGKKPSGSRDPYGLRRSAIGLCRLAIDGGVRVERTLLPSEVRDFVEERLESMLDVPVEFVRAARGSAATDLAGLAGLARTLARAERSVEFDAIHTAYGRAHRLAGKAEAEAARSLDESLLADPAERDLAAALAGTTIEPNGDLAAAASLAPHVNRFFDEVLVMDEDARVRANRLRLLLDVRDALGRLGDFSLIPR